MTRFLWCPLTLAGEREIIVSSEVRKKSYMSTHCVSRLEATPTVCLNAKYWIPDFPGMTYLYMQYAPEGF